MVCTKCGAELKDTDLFCLNCGQEVQIVPDYNPVEEMVIKNLAEAQQKHIKSEEAKEAQTTQNDKIENRKPKTTILKKYTPMFCSRYLYMFIAFILLVVLAVFSIQKIHNNSFEYQYAKAVDCFQAGEYDKAYGYLNKALKINTNDIEAHLLMVDVYIQLKNVDGAIVMLRETLDIDPTNAKAAKKLIQLYSEGNFVVELQSYLEQIDGTLLATDLGEFYLNKPTFSIKAGTYDKYISVELTSKDNCEVYYSVDGTAPTTSAIKYSGQIRLRGGTTMVRAVAVNELGELSAETIKQYTVNSTVPDNPVIIPASGQYISPTPIQITVPRNCKVYYTWDGTEPTQNSQLYTKPLDMQLGKHVLSVVAIDNNGIVSNTIQSSYDLEFASNYTIEQAYVILMQKLGSELVDEKGAFQLECCSAIEIGGYNLYAFEKVYGTDENGNKIYGTDKYTFDVLTAETFIAVTNVAGGYDMTPF